jgi:hypothetical protein
MKNIDKIPYRGSTLANAVFASTFLLASSAAIEATSCGLGMSYRLLRWRLGISAMSSRRDDCRAVRGLVALWNSGAAAP